MNKKGITLIEMLIVIAIIGIITAIAIPAYIGQQKRAARTEATTNLQNLRLLEEQFFAENGEYAPDAAPLTRNYNGTSADDNGIEDILPGFKPAGLDNTTQFNNLNFTYTLTGTDGTTFLATATGKANTRVDGDVCTINQDNNRTGPW